MDAVDDSGRGAAAPMSREGVDHALRGLREEQERISAALLDLEGHDGSRLLKGAELAGETCRRWSEARDQVAMVWRLYHAYRDVLGTAADLRERHARPGAATLVELTGLLAGDSVELPGGEVPLERRTLLGGTRERVSLGEAVARMSEGYARAAEVVGAADAAWTALLVPLEDVQERWRDAARLAAALGGPRSPELDRLGRELTALAHVSRTDPLSMVRDGRPDTARLDRLLEALDALHGSLAEAVRLRDGYGPRVASVAAAIDAVDEAERAARAVRAEADLKIAAAGLPEPPASAPALRGRLAAADALRRTGRWRELAARVTELDRAAATALDRARAAERLAADLLGRRGELRGRLDAYRAKADRLGRSGDVRLAGLYAAAHDRLWTAPCDLRQATHAVAAYRRALGEETGRAT